MPGCYSEAAEKYARARDNLTGMTNSEAVQLRRACVLNLSSCYLNNKQYRQCVDCCQEVLSGVLTDATDGLSIKQSIPADSAVYACSCCGSSSSWPAVRSQAVLKRRCSCSHPTHTCSSSTTFQPDSAVYEDMSCDVCTQRSPSEWCACVLPLQKIHKTLRPCIDVARHMLLWRTTGRPSRICRQLHDSASLTSSSCSSFRTSSQQCKTS